MPLPSRAVKVPDRAEDAGHGIREMAVMDAVDRLFDDFVVIVIIGMAVSIAIYIMRAMKKLFSGMVN